MTVSRQQLLETGLFLEVPHSRDLVVRETAKHLFDTNRELPLGAIACRLKFNPWNELASVELRTEVLSIKKGKAS